MPHPFDLQRFVDAQNSHGAYDAALREIRAGRKTGHWIWFVFPQIAGLGRSSTAQHYAISGLGEAKAYLAHSVLGPRLEECCLALLDLSGTDAEAIFGSLDAMKLRSSMTLFARVSNGGVFSEVLARYFEGREDEATISILSRQP